MCALPAKRQLLACGHNETGKLTFLPHCRRWHINGENPCGHNAWTVDGRSYCARMVLRPIHVLWTDNIRVIASFPSSSFLDINGCWQVLPPQLGLKARFDYPAAKDIKQLFQFGDSTKLGFYTENGGLWTLDLLQYGTKGLHVYYPTWSREILHLCFGGQEPLVLLVHKAEPEFVIQFTSFSDCMAWLVGPQEPGVMAFSLGMHAPIQQIVGNLSAFTIRVEGGDVYTWDAKPFTLCPGERIVVTSVHASVPDAQQIKTDIDSTTNLTPEESALPKPKAEDDLQAQSRQGLSPRIKEENSPDTQSASNKPVDPQIKIEEQPSPPIKTESLSEEEADFDMSLYDDFYKFPFPPPKPVLPPNTPVIRRLLLPPSTHLIAARFITGSLSELGVHLWRDPTTDDPQAPHLSDIGTAISPTLQYLGEGIKLVDVSISAHHIVAVSEGGEVFSKGRGWHGELGVGERVFDLRADFAGGWMRMDLGDVRQGMRVRRVYTGEGTTFLVAEKIVGEEEMERNA